MLKQGKTQWIKTVNRLIADDLLKIYPQFIEGYFDSAGSDWRINPSPCCGHNDCFTLTPGFDGFHCFSCNASGSHYKLFLEKSGLNERELIKKLSDILGISEPFWDLQLEAVTKVLQAVIDIYHEELLKDDSYLKYQTDTRKHNIETLIKYKVGKSIGFLELRERLNNMGLDPLRYEMAVHHAGLFVYPYEDPETGFMRFNTKNPFKCVDNRGELIQGFSTGEKSLLYSKPFSFNEVIVVEGENDLLSLVEAGAQSVVALGGSPSASQINELMAFKKIYLMLDNDEGGNKTAALLNDKLPHIPVCQVEYDQSFKDPDDYFKNNNEPVAIEQLLTEAKEMTTEKFHINHVASKWSLATRQIRFDCKLSHLKNGSLNGDVRFFENGIELEQWYQTNIFKLKPKKQVQLWQSLVREIQEYYNEPDSSLDFKELLNMYSFSSKPQVILKLIAEKLSEQKLNDEMLDHITKKIGISARDELLREMNEIKISCLDMMQIFPKIRLSSHFGVKKDDAYFFVPFIKKDGDIFRKIPYVLSNKGELIRLDLYKRKDPQALLLLENKYEIPEEVSGIILEPQDASLHQSWALKFSKNEVDLAELNISKLVYEMEQFIKKFFYTENEDIYKVLAIWSYGTYYYELFRQYPYLLINGSKGTGKTLLGSTLKYICFNARHFVGLTGPSLFRTINIEGGTLILDELEFLTDSKKAFESDLGMFLKAGYSEGAKVRRLNADKNFMPEDFDVDCPKVLLNISGIEQVISDRCISVNTEQIDPTKIQGLLDPKNYCNENLDKIRELTSKCCLSALIHFQEIYKVFAKRDRFAETARLSQIMWPLITIARAAGDGYVKSLERYYEKSIKKAKKDIENSTPEGVLKQVITEAAYELKKLKEPLVTDTNRYRYTKEIKLLSKDELTTRRVKGNFADGEQYLAIDSLNLKEMIEDRLPNLKLKDLNEISKWMKHTYGDTITANRGTLKLEEMYLAEEFGNKKEITGKRFYIPISVLINGEKDFSEIEIDKNEGAVYDNSHLVL
jgi:5S rRNA maturation endonuclease (ribonuclease M5)